MRHIIKMDNISTIYMYKIFDTHYMCIIIISYFTLLFYICSLCFYFKVGFNKIF